MWLHIQAVVHFGLIVAFNRDFGVRFEFETSRYMEISLNLLSCETFSAN